VDLAKARVRQMCLCWKLCVSSPVRAFQTLAEKSADAVAATSAVSFRTQDQTAPCARTVSSGDRQEFPRGGGGAFAPFLLQNFPKICMTVFTSLELSQG